MAIPEYKNGQFEEMAAWSQILQIVAILPIIWHPWQPWICLHIEVQIYYSIWKCGKNLSQMSLCVRAYYPNIYTVPVVLADLIWNKTWKPEKLDEIEKLF